MNDRELRLFNLWAIRTKDELLGAIDEYIDRIEQHDDIEIVRKGRSKPLVDVMKDFRKKVARTPLADLDQDFCAYEVECLLRACPMMIPRVADTHSTRCR